MSTAVTASVWGQGLAAIKLSALASRGMQEGDEECHICRDDIPATIAFVPCKHKVCFNCMENMRAKNIFKADKGIKCPFCRQYVDGYKSVHQATPDIQKFLFEANKAAAVAAAARAAAERKANPQLQQQHAPALATGAAGRQQQGASSSGVAGTTTSADGDQVWNCGSCGERNYFWREFCGRCKRPCLNPYGSDKLAQTRKDLGQVSGEELVGYLHEQGGYCLRKGLKDMGVSLDSMRSYGSPACVREAVAHFGIKKRVLHLADLLADPDTLQAAALHHMGNLGVQRILEGVVKLRAALGPGTGKPQHPDVQAYINSHGGKDPFGSMLSALCSRMLEFCWHDKGVYVLQTATTLASTAELVELAQAAFPLTLAVSNHPRGVFVLLGLLDQLSARIWDDPVNCEPGLKAIDLLCQQYTLDDKQLLHNAMHALSGKVMVRAIAIAMPRFPALKLAVKIACHASSLWPTTGGQYTLGELLQLYGHNQEAAEGLRDVVTCMCYSTQGQIARMALGTDNSVHELLLSLIERLGHEQEVGWLDACSQEMVGVVDQLVGSLTGIEILKFTLTQPCLDLDTITAHITDMKSILPKQQLLPLVADLMELVSSNPPPPLPKYPAASVIQPELRYFLSEGYPTPLPPPPPPRPGAEGYDAYVAAAAARAEAQALAASEARAARSAETAARREAAAAAAAAAGTSSGQSSAVVDAWSKIHSGADVGGQAGSSNPWDLGPMGSSAAEAAGASNSHVGDPWGAAAGASSADGWGGAAAVNSPTGNGWGGSGAGAAAAADPWSLPASATSSGVPVGASVAPPISALVPVPIAAPLASAAVNRGGVPVAAAVAAPVAVPVAVPVAAPVAAPIAAPVAVPVASPAVASRAPPAAPPRGLPAAGVRAGPPVMPAPAQDFAAGPTPQQAAQMANSRARSATPTQPLQQHYQQRQQQHLQQQQQRPSSAPVRRQQQPAPQQHWEAPGPQPVVEAAVDVDGPWACQVCTYEHTGPECKFLSCAMCGTPKR